MAPLRYRENFRKLGVHNPADDGSRPLGTYIELNPCGLGSRSRALSCGVDHVQTARPMNMDACHLIRTFRVPRALHFCTEDNYT